MANVNSTLGNAMPAKSYPERIALGLFKLASNWRLLLAFFLVLALTGISITFNVLLGNLSGADSISKIILPVGYALLDLSALFLSGYIGMKAFSIWRKLFAWLWFGFLLCLSLWAAASFTLAIDSMTQNQNLERSIDQKRTELIALNSDVDIWQNNVANTENFRTRYQKTLEDIQHRQLMTSDELHALEMNRPKPTMAIYNMTAPLLGVTPETLQTLVRLLWAGALTLSPLVIMLLISAEKPSTTTTPSKKAPRPAEMPTTRSSWTEKLQNWRNRRKVRQFMAKTQRAKTAFELRQKNAELPENRALQTNFVAAQRENVAPVKGNNQHTEAVDLNGLNHAKAWLKEQAKGRVTRDKITRASKIKSREGVSKIIEALIEAGLLQRLANGQYIKPERPILQLVKQGV